MGYEPVGRILPTAPVPSLVTSARRLTGVNWQSGIHWAPSCQQSFARPYCPPEPTLETGVERDTVHANPFTIYTPARCDVTTVDMSDQETIVVDFTDVHTASGLAAALWMGTGLPADDLEQVTLRRNATDVSGAAPYDLDDGVAALLAHYEAATGGNGGAMIHLSVQLVPAALGGGAGGARVAWPEGNVYRGPSGSVVVPGPGYPIGASADGADGYGPLTVAGPPEQYAGNADDEAWVYITGPVEYDVTPVVARPDAERDRVQFRSNVYEVWGQRQAIVRFDPCSTFAVLVNNPAPLAEFS